MIDGKGDLNEDFIHFMKYVMVENKPEPTVERLVRFIAKTIAKAGNDKQMFGLFKDTMDFLLKSHEANHKAIRYRVCQIIALTVDYIGNGELDNDLCDDIIKCMHARLSDKIPSKVCADKLLQAWLTHYQANVLDLLGGLDTMSSGEICERSVNHIISKVSVEEILDGFDLLDEKLAATLSSDESKYEEKATTEYIIQQLIQCIQYLDISDPVSRSSVLALCKNLLSNDNLSLSLAPHLMHCLEQVLRVPQERVAEVATIISDIQMPNVTEEVPVDPDTLHQLKYKLAKVRMNLNELSELMAEAVAQQDFASAAQVKEKIEILEESKKALTEEMTPKPVTVPAETRTDAATTLKCLTIFVELMTSGDMCTMTDTIRSYMEELVIPSIPHSCPAIRKQAIKALGLCALCDQEVARKFLPIFLQICQLDDEAIKVSAIESLFDIIMVHGLECFQEKDTKSGSAPDEPEKLDNSDSDEVEEGGDREDVDPPPGNDVFTKEGDTSTDSTESQVYRSANDLIQMLVNFLEDDSSTIRTLCAEGLSKLLLTARIVSSKLLSRLVILWYNPVTEEDVRLRHCLGVFFPVYAFSSRDNQVQVEEAFIPTLQVIFDAPATSPLSDIDESNVVELLVQLTDPTQVKKVADQSALSGMTSHDSLAVKICNEIIERDNMYGVVVLAKALTMLQLSQDNELLARDLSNLSIQLSQVVKDKVSLKSIDKFKVKVDELKSKHVSIDSTADDNVGVEVAAKETTGEIDAAAEEIDSTVLDTTSLATSKLKRSAANTARSRINGSLDTMSSKYALQMEYNFGTGEILQQCNFDKTRIVIDY
ncbi:NCAPG [Bugula neritina]|uniref:NCAPG n=1 Tax=Bugula neritina TaxID=10212 RepID=A0A7J7JM33_BUGNE|nr:NCAPG [Bugula neritina]